MSDSEDIAAIIINPVFERYGEMGRVNFKTNRNGYFDVIFSDGEIVSLPTGYDGIELYYLNGDDRETGFDALERKYSDINERKGRSEGLDITEIFDLEFCELFDKEKLRRILE
ncbi:MAG: hypothetical protein AABW73_01330 [Nanoarchaeota archaeon]